jgi:aryl-alcohol dehydrogenase
MVGAGVIVAVDRNTERLALAAELGATASFTPTDSTLTAALSDCQREGIDYILDTTGDPPIIGAGADALAPGGVCGLVAMPRGSLTFSPLTLTSGRSVRSIMMGDAVPATAIPELLRHWESGELPFDRLITTYPLSAIDRAEGDARAGTTIKPVLIPAD